MTLDAFLNDFFLPAQMKFLRAFLQRISKLKYLHLYFELTRSFCFRAENVIALFSSKRSAFATETSSLSLGQKFHFVLRHINCFLICL
jgi:hypothetical protein